MYTQLRHPELGDVARARCSSRSARSGLRNRVRASRRAPANYLFPLVPEPRFNDAAPSARAAGPGALWTPSVARSTAPPDIARCKRVFRERGALSPRASPIVAQLIDKNLPHSSSSPSHEPDRKAADSEISFRRRLTRATGRGRHQRHHTNNPLVSFQKRSTKDARARRSLAPMICHCACYTRRR